MRILIADDEHLARSRLAQLVDRIGNHEIIGEARDGHEAIIKTEDLKPDVVLMDIRMPQMDGMEAALHLSKTKKPPAVIFTTAFDRHALEAFNAHALDYILKPIRKERLEEALNRAKAISTDHFKDPNRPVARTHISVSLRNRITLVPIRDIVYFQADSKYVVARTENEHHLLLNSLLSLEKEFSDQFIRIHRNALVNKHYVQGIEKSKSGGWQIILDGVPERLDISRRHIANVKRWTKTI